MLLLSAPRTIIVDGVTVFPDHADPNQFWYLPGPVTLARRPDNQADFTLIKYKPAAVEGGAKGGGFVMFSTCLKLDRATEGKIMSRLSGIAPGAPMLSLVPFDSGTVRCIALNVEGSGGTTAKAASPGAFNAVESILGATTPSLQGDEQAAFSLTLSQEGATILEQAYKQGTGPVGVVYDLKFTGMRPALDVIITADSKSVYDGLSASLSGQYYFVKASLEAAFEKLKQERVIKIQVFHATTDEDSKEKEKWALDFFKEKLLTDWFQPTLDVGNPKVKLPESAGLPDPVGAVTSAVKKGKDGGSDGGSQAGADAGNDAAAKDAAPSAPSEGAAADPPAAGDADSAVDKGADDDASASHSGPPTTAGKTVTAATAPAAASRQAASLEILSRNPDRSSEGYDIQHTPSTSGLTETIKITGGDTVPTVKVDGTPQPLDASRQLTIEVAPEGHHDITVEYAGGERPAETFELLFQYDLPAEAGFKSSASSPAYKAYLTNTTTDKPFRRSKAPNGNSTSRGAQALRDWVATLAEPKVVEMDAHASWEGHPETDTATIQHNLDLSNRRLQVAVGIIGDKAEKKFVGTGATGDSEARSANRPSKPGGTDDNHDRVTRIKGFTGPAAAGATINARISRPADLPPPPPPDKPKPDKPQPDKPKPDKPKPDKPKPDQPKPDKPKPGKPKPDQPDSPSGDGQIAGAPQVAFKLKYVHQEEHKRMVFEFHRSDAVQRTYAPQGFFGLMINDLSEDRKHFVEVDLDDPFFRQFAVTVQAPINFQKIGLQSSHVSLDYGNPQDAANHKHGDVIFDASRPKEFKFAVFMNAQHDTTYRYATEYHFDPDSGWDARAFSYQFPPRTSEDRNLFLNPYDQIGFLEVQVFPHQMDAGVMDSVDVELTHTDPGGQVVQRTLNVTPGSQPQFWKVRLDDPQARTYTYQLTHHLKDGTVKRGEPVTTRATALPVNDPFERAIEIDFVPNLNTVTTRMVFIDIQYDDDKNAYHRQERLALQGNTQNVVHQRIALMNPAKKDYRYRFTFVGQDGQLKQGAFKETNETLIAVTDAQ
ncbi:MAG TPA: hypothetical protein VKL40_02430 [Candidatus Angelobacter sp.]|nr:hypothetical protein [Candidatus Angelobacter sp.]